jgi:hypothetical protein
MGWLIRYESFKLGSLAETEPILKKVGKPLNDTPKDFFVSHMQVDRMPKIAP